METSGNQNNLQGSSISEEKSLMKVKSEVIDLTEDDGNFVVPYKIFLVVD